jgi:hypothetical protein
MGPKPAAPGVQAVNTSNVWSPIGFEEYISGRIRMDVTAQGLPGPRQNLQGIQR